MKSKSPLSPVKRESASNFSWLVFLLISALLLVLYAPLLVSALQSNIAWLNLNTSLSSETPFTSNLGNEPTLFSQALMLDDENQSALFGLGLTNIFRGESDSTITLWGESQLDPSLLIAYGLFARGKGDLDAALVHFRAAEARAEEAKREGHFLAGTICQRAFAPQQLLDASNSQYCTNYLADNGNNLIINGDFSTGALFGWEGEHFFTGKNKARLKLQDANGTGDEAVRLIGQDENIHFGLYQPLTLAEGDTVRFSGRFKISGQENLTARLLYIGWQKEDGTPQGNHGAQQSAQMEWTEFERIFQVPENSKPTVNFYPVMFSGEGTIWFDDIHLELIND